MTLQIGVWALIWSGRVVWASADPCVPENIPFPEEMLKRTKSPFDVLAWVAMIGHDSDTYGATAGAMLAAAHEEEIPTYFTDGLEVLAKFDALRATLGQTINDAPAIEDDSDDEGTTEGHG